MQLCVKCIKILSLKNNNSFHLSVVIIQNCMKKYMLILMKNNNYNNLISVYRASSKFPYCDIFSKGEKTVCTQQD